MDSSTLGSSVHGIFQVRVLEWVAISSSSRPSPPRDWTGVSLIAGRRFTVWATREARYKKNVYILVIKEVIMQVCSVWCVCVCVLNCFSHIGLFVTLWIIALQVPTSEISQARKLDWVSMPSSKASSQPRVWTLYLLCLLHWQMGSLTLAPPIVCAEYKANLSKSEANTAL